MHARVYDEDGHESGVTPAALEWEKRFEQLVNNPVASVEQRTGLIAHYHAGELSEQDIDARIDARMRLLERQSMLTGEDMWARCQQKCNDVVERYKRQKETGPTKETWRKSFDTLIDEMIGDSDPELAVSQETLLLLGQVFGHEIDDPALQEDITPEILFTLAEAANEIGLRGLTNGHLITQGLKRLSKDTTAEPLHRLKATELCSSISSQETIELCRGFITEHGLEGEEWWKSRVTRYPALAAALMTKPELAPVREALEKKETVENEKQMLAEAFGITVPLLDRLQGAKETSKHTPLLEALPTLSALAAIDINRIPFYGRDQKAFVALIKAIPYCNAMEQFGVAPIDALKKMTDVPPGIIKNMELMHINPDGFAHEIQDFINSFRRAVIIPEVMAQARAKRVRIGSILKLLDKDVESIPLYNTVFDKMATSPSKIHDVIAKWQRHVPNINAELFEAEYTDKAWPTVTGNYTGAHGIAKDFVVCPLKSAAEVMDIAKPENQDNCVAGHLREVRKGQLHVCAIKDPEGNTIATAGYTMPYSSTGQILGVHFYQNYAKGNTAASAEAQAAFNEYLDYLRSPAQYRLLNDYTQRRGGYLRELAKQKNISAQVDAHFDFNWENEEKRHQSYKLYKEFLPDDASPDVNGFLNKTGLQETISAMIKKCKDTQKRSIAGDDSGA
ncbi:MAG: hypothetical protein KGI29_07890 [Pseudomonadota bacterium]|nr:hypothetical protein [Pseudomonadota bacterium]MDE3037937.1 hypothetical protein [Pseudomonadota bacterium]